ncbi:MAG: hypothetical protein V1772_09680 [Chloroflexota bacterium]
MPQPRIRSLIAVLCLLLALSPRAARAQEAAGARSLLVRDSLLVPVGGPGFVALTAGTVQVEVRCQASACALDVEHRYRLHNRDQVRPGNLALTWPAAQSAGGVVPEVTLGEPRGRRLAPKRNETTGRSTWELSLARNETALLTLRYATSARSEAFIAWRWDEVPAGAWGLIESVRYEMVFPQPLTDDALVQIAPGDYRWEGQRLTWDYESIEALPQHDLLLLAPPMHQRLVALRASSAHLEVARAYMALDEAARRAQLPWPDHYGLIVSELRAGLETDPSNRQARLDLVAQYRARAQLASAPAVNYALLAAQELSQLLAQRPNDTVVARSLGEIYYEAARAAADQNDPAGALVYLHEATQVAGNLIPGLAAAQRDLTMRWAVDLAERGQVSQALEQAKGLLSAGTADILLRYAPPLTAAQMSVFLEPQARTVTYLVFLYPSTAMSTQARLSQIADRLAALGSRWRVTLTPAGPELGALRLEVAVTFADVAELPGQAQALAVALTDTDDLLARLVAAPWQTEVQRYALTRSPWLDRLEYREQVDTRALAAAVAAQGEYSRWHMVELRANRPDEAQARLERDLTLIALREQRQVWEMIGGGTFWVYKVRHPDPATTEPIAWQVGWDQTRDLEVSYPVYHWGAIALSALGVLALIILFASVALVQRRPA